MNQNNNQLLQKHRFNQFGRVMCRLDVNCPKILEIYKNRVDRHGFVRDRGGVRERVNDLYSDSPKMFFWGKSVNFNFTIYYRNIPTTLSKVYETGLDGLESGSI